MTGQQSAPSIRHIVSGLILCGLICGALLATPVFAQQVQAVDAPGPMPPVIFAPPGPTNGPASTPPPLERLPAPNEQRIVIGEPILSGPAEAMAEPWYSFRGCPECQPWLRIYQGSSYGALCPCPQQDRLGLSLDGVARAYYINDQRINWTGLEATFGAEGVLIPRFIHEFNGWNISANGVFFVNQPIDRNMLNGPELQSYQASFQVDPIQIWNLNLRFTKGDFSISFGKDNTPFGRYYFPVFTNARLDTPFIRSEAIKWVETGIFARYSPGMFVFDGAITNGTPDRDTNSMKAFIVRAGVQDTWFAAGISGKYQDGIGSEHQKEYNNHYGGDAMLIWGQFDLSGEVIYDQYGFWRDFDPNDVTWGRSLYYRDLFSGRRQVPLSGVGYYLNLGWSRPSLRTDLNYGEYYPRAIDNPLNDTPVRRGVVKGTWLMTPHAESYTALIFENDRPLEEFRHFQLGFAFFTGTQLFF